MKICIRFFSKTEIIVFVVGALIGILGFSKILNYLLKLSKASLDEDSREVVDGLFNTVNDIERIGDHAENIAELAIETEIGLLENFGKNIWKWRKSLYLCAPVRLGR